MACYRNDESKPNKVKVVLNNSQTKLMQSLWCTIPGNEESTIKYGCTAAFSDQYIIINCLKPKYVILD